MRPKLHAVLVDLSAIGQAEDLIAAAISEDGFVPANELVEAATALNQFIARPQHQMIGVAKDDTGADFLKMLRSQGLNRALGADRHEHGRLDLAT